jgi:hypothetical protein
MIGVRYAVGETDAVGNQLRFTARPYRIVRVSPTVSRNSRNRSDAWNTISSCFPTLDAQYKVLRCLSERGRKH